MGIDGERISNINHRNLAVSLGFSAQVKRKSREMADVVGVKVLESNPKMFQIKYRDLDSNSIVTREYEAVSDYEAAEIVAKIEFLRSHM